MRVRGLLDRFRVKVVGFKVQGLGKTRANTTGKLHARTYSYKDPEMGHRTLFCKTQLKPTSTLHPTAQDPHPKL